MFLSVLVQGARAHAAQYPVEEYCQSTDFEQHWLYSMVSPTAAGGKC